MGPTKKLNTFQDLANTWDSEIFQTGAENMFYPKSPIAKEPWKRTQHKEQKACQGEPIGAFPLSQLYDARKIEERRRRLEDAEELNREETGRFESDLDESVELEELPEEFPVVCVSEDWDAAIPNSRERFKGHLTESWRSLRVAIEAHVRNRRAQRIAINKEQRGRYSMRRSRRCADSSADQILVRDLIMSPDCISLPHSDYACPIC
jgi:hypothetical protein